MAITGDIKFNVVQKDKFHYSEVLELGFKRENLQDHLFFNQNGYEWFVVTKKLSKGIKAEWDCETHTIEIIRYDKEDNVLGRMSILSREHLKSILNFFGKEASDG